jgi:hypothetical protein
MAKKVAEIVVEVLQAAGVQNCYGIVGDTFNTFAAALSKSEISWVHSVLLTDLNSEEISWGEWNGAS